MKLFVRFQVFFVAVLIGVNSYHLLTQKSQSEILGLTKAVNEAYKNQECKFLEEILADDLLFGSSEHNAIYGKSDFLQGLNSYKTSGTKITAIEVNPLWIQANQTKSSITFELKGTVLDNNKSSVYYGQYTYTFEKRQGSWRIFSINFDINYRENKPHWLARMTLGLDRILKRFRDEFSCYTSRRR